MSFFHVLVLLFRHPFFSSFDSRFVLVSFYSWGLSVNQVTNYFPSLLHWKVLTRLLTCWVLTRLVYLQFFWINRVWHWQEIGVTTKKKKDEKSSQWKPGLLTSRPVLQFHHSEWSTGLLTPFRMRQRISIRGRVRPSVRPSVGPYVYP